MKEKYLHYLWQNKLLPFHQMTFVSGESFNVVYPGDYNKTESGPDFFNAQILTDGILWNGNVELHVRSSDWYRHGHQNDPAYENVVLHVVYEHDREIVIGERTIPTLELKDVISVVHYENYLIFFKRRNTILCASQIAQLERVTLLNMQERALIKRLHRKTEFLDEFRSVPGEALYLMLAKAMGAKVNQLPFEELARRLPLNSVRRMGEQHRQKVILQTGGLYIPETPSEWIDSSRTLSGIIGSGETMNPHSWKYGGVRPGSAPDVRLRQFAALIKKLDPDLFIEIARREDVREYFHRHFSFDEGSFRNHPGLKQLSKGAIDLILINAVAPFIWWLGQIKNDDELAELAFTLLCRIPVEQNSIISKWQKLGVDVENAYESQAMLEIFNEFCFRKKCLSCGIGKSLLGR
jgi:hypothetical protein